MPTIETTPAKRRLPAFAATVLATATVMALVLVTAYPNPAHAQTEKDPINSPNWVAASKPINVSAAVVEGSESADGSTVTVELDWEASATLIDELEGDSSVNLTGFCYEVRTFEGGLQLSGVEYCRDSADDRSVEFDVSTSLSYVELQVRFVVNDTIKGTNSDTVTVTLDG